uniref:C2H2-type domain-containing protein n=1 Tax=Photinus pyralis TaxID=7054 RepID=A0A1Y1LLJ8_PHOPY
MIVCKQCHGKYKSLAAFITHYEIFHKNVKSILCGISDCYREFNSCKSFRKHFSRVHRDFSVEEPLNNQSPNTERSHSLSNDVVSAVIDSLSSNSESDNICAFSYREMILKNTSYFVSKLYGDRVLARNKVIRIINDVHSLLKSFVNIIKQNLTFLGIVGNEQKITNLLNEVDNCLSTFSTEYRCVKYFKNEKLFVEPKKHLVGTKICRKKHFGKITLKSINHCVRYISMVETMALFFQLPGVLQKTKAHVNALLNEQNLFCNYIQGPHWKEKLIVHDDNCMVLPLFLYFDEFETGNPLGSHSGCNKLGGIYYSIPCLPTDIQSNLSNIFVAMLFKTTDLKLFGKKVILKCIIDELNSLSTHGIVINGEKIKFQLALLLGDNLGQNTMLGLVESFTSHYCCRLCKSPKLARDRQCKEDLESIRTVDNYFNDSSNYEYGVKEMCVWHSVKNFHLASNFSVDIMHDVLEGVCVYDIVLILRKCLEAKLFSLETLNYRIKCFNFGFESNVPPPIKMMHLNDNHLRMSAAEMLCFTRYLGVIIGDLVPKGFGVWKLYRSLRKLIDYLTSKKLQINCAAIIANIVEEHNQLYLEFSKSHLKFKYHILTHYPRVFKHCGPFPFYSSIRFEAKHKNLKAIANSICSRVNIEDSILKRLQLSLSFHLLSLKYNTEPKRCMGNLKKETVAHLHKMFANLIIPNDLRNVEEIFTCTWVQFFENRYSINTNFTLIDSLSDDQQPSFCILKKILYIKEKIYFLVEETETVYFDEHYYAYKINTSAKFKLILASDLCSHVPCLFVKRDYQFVVCHHRL